MLKDSFLKYLLLERNYSEKTILSYGIDLDEFEAYFKGVDVELEFTSVDADVVRGWVLSLMDEGRAETTVNRKLSSLRSFYHYLLRQKLVAVEPVALAVLISEETWEISLEIFSETSLAEADEAAMPEETDQDRERIFVPVFVSLLMMPFAA